MGGRELLQAQDPEAAAGELVRGGASHDAESDDGDVEAARAHRGDCSDG